MNRETLKALRILRQHEQELENYDFRPGRRVPRVASPHAEMRERRQAFWFYVIELAFVAAVLLGIISRLW